MARAFHLLVISGLWIGLLLSPLGLDFFLKLCVLSPLTFVPVVVPRLHGLLFGIAILLFDLLAIVSLLLKYLCGY